MSNAFYICNDCEFIWDENAEACPNCKSNNIYFDQELVRKDHMEIWTLDEDHAIVIDKDENGEEPDLQ